ncbi:MAG: arsenic resistance protein [Hyphomicrobiaceae bacterium]
MLWPTLGLLLLATFTQVPLTHVRAAFHDRRFMAAVLVGNFLAIPLLLALFIQFIPDDPALRLGVLLVLLVPCTDWFITFTHLGGGDTGRAIAVTPVNLLVQLALLPVYLWLFMGNAFLELLAADRLLAVFVSLIVLPLCAAWAIERWGERKPERTRLIGRIGWLPVPLLGLVVFLIAASQVEPAIAALSVMGHVLGVFVAFLVVAALLGIGLARVFRLPNGEARALVYSLGTRNSFVVLPLALALPEMWAAAVVVIVLQSLVELFGMAAYLWLVPRILLPSGREEARVIHPH